MGRWLSAAVCILQGDRFLRLPDRLLRLFRDALQEAHAISFP